MSLHVYCSKYGRYIPKYMLENLLEEGLTVKEVSAVICVAERTIFRQVNGYNLSDMNFKNFKHLKRCMRYV